MAKHKDTRNFILGALIGGIVGAAAISASRSNGKKKTIIRETLKHVGKAIQSSKTEKNLEEIMDWTVEGIQLWNKLKKGN